MPQICISEKFSSFLFGISEGIPSKRNRNFEWRCLNLINFYVLSRPPNLKTSSTVSRTQLKLQLQRDQLLQEAERKVMSTEHPKFNNSEEDSNKIELRSIGLDVPPQILKVIPKENLRFFQSCLTLTTIQLNKNSFSNFPIGSNKIGKSHTLPCNTETEKSS